MKQKPSSFEILIFYLFILNTLDFITTMVALPLGATEVNKLANHLFYNAPILVIFLKLIGTPLLLFIVILSYNKFAVKKTTQRFYFICYSIALIIYGGVVGNNIGIIISLI